VCPVLGVNVTKNILRVVVSLLAIGIVCCAISPGASAQVGNGCFSWVSCGYYSLWNMVCEPQLPPGVYNCEGVAFEWEVICQVQNYLCPPAAAAVETKCDCSVAGSPIALATGNTYIMEADVKLPGLSGGLTLVRTWNSVWPSTQLAYQTGLFGPNWRSNFEERVFLGNDNYMKYARGDGSFWSFGWGTPSGAGWSVAAPANVIATLVQGASYWTITFQNGEQRRFDNTSGNLVAIIDRNGNTTQLSYDSAGRLATVTDPVSRHLYFTYGSGSSLLVTGVTSDVGLSLSYAYDAQSRLTTVTNPDLSTLSFGYDSHSLISSVTDSNGKILEAHTYDNSMRGLTSSRANGVDAVTVSYGTP
jgi:YD repeat-containing protein